MLRKFVKELFRIPGGGSPPPPRQRLPLLARNTLWYWIIFGLPALLVIVGIWIADGLLPWLVSFLNYCGIMQR